MGVKSFFGFIISLLANAVITVGVLVFSDEIKAALPSNILINWPVNNVLYLSAGAFGVIILLLVLRIIRYVKNRPTQKYFSVYKPKRFTVAEAARLFLMPAANPTFYTRAKVEELLKVYTEAEVKKAGILLKGPSGVGKSRLAYHLAVNGVDGRKFKSILVPRDVPSLEAACKDEKLTLSAKSVLIFDNFEDFADVEGLVAFIEKNRGRCFYVATVRGERGELLMADSPVGGIPKAALARLHEINVPKLQADEAAEAAAALGDEAPGYDTDAPPDTFAWLVKDLTHELKYYEDCRTANAPEARVLEALALAAFSGYTITPPTKAEVEKLTRDILGYACDVSQGLANLEKAERITLRDGAYYCRFEYLVAIWFGYVAHRVQAVSRVRAAFSRETEVSRRDAALILAEGSYESGERELAFNAVAAALAAFRSFAGVHFVAGNIYAETDREKAAAFYEEALRRNPEYAEAQNNYGVLIEKLGRDEEAEGHYREALRINPESAEAHYNYATLLQKLGREEEAEGHYRETLRISPGSADAYYNYATLLQKLGRYEEAEDNYREGFRVNPESAEAHNNYANLLEKLGRDEEAEGHYGEALRINPESPEPHNNFANLLEKLGRYEEAEGHYREALRINPESAEPHNNYAVLLKKLRRYEEAKGYYREALRINPEYAEAHNNYAVLLKKLGRDEEAGVHYREALRINPEYTEAHNNYAGLLERLGCDEEAEGHYREALRINADLCEPNGAYSVFLAKRGRCPEAILYATRFFELAPEHANVRDLKEFLEEKCPDA